MANAYQTLKKLSTQERLIEYEDPMVVIEKRLQEIKQMTRVKRDRRHVLERYAPEVRDLIMKYKDIPVADIRKQRRKKGEKLIDKLRRSAWLAVLLIRGFHGRTKYYLDQTNVSQIRRKMESLVEHGGTGVPIGRASIGFDLQVSLSTQPQHRDRKQIKQILWMLRATKAFKHLFPEEMEDQVARTVAYERYDDGRIMSYQSRTPDRFYYILSGRVTLLRQYKLSTGQITKSMGFLTKGMTTDPEEMNKQWMREDTLVTKGQVEVLIFDKKSFTMLQHTTDGPPLDFLRSLDLFLEFPVERFLNSHDAIEVIYYGQGKSIAKDSNRTPWLHVVKSGLVKVVRRQSVIDTRLSNDSKFTSPAADHLGCGKSFSHADAMLGVQAKQKKLKAMKDALNLPMIETTANPFQGTLGVPSPIIYRHSAQHSVISEKDEFDDDDSHTDNHRVMINSPKGSHVSHSPTNNDHYEPHSLWLTRERTNHEPMFPRIQKKNVPNRRAYLQLDVLKTGDVFGLDHLQQAVASEPRGVSLLSDGAEIIRISKRFFLQNAVNNTMLKVETMYKEYLTEEEAKQSLYHKETWAQYKAILWTRMTAPSQTASAADR